MWKMGSPFLEIHARDQSGSPLLGVPNQILHPQCCRVCRDTPSLPPFPQESPFSGRL
jgi:hypothetical protein